MSVPISSHSIYCSCNFDLCPSLHFLYLTRKEKVSQKGNKSKVKERQTPFCRQEFIYDLTKFQKDWSNIALVGAHGKLYCQSSEKIRATEYTPMLPLSYSRCLLRNIWIQHTYTTYCISLFIFQIITLFKNFCPKFE